MINVSYVSNIYLYRKVYRSYLDAMLLGCQSFVSVESLKKKVDNISVSLKMSWEFCRNYLCYCSEIFGFNIVVGYNEEGYTIEIIERVQIFY